MKPASPAGIRLQKVLAAAGAGSRRRCEEFIVAGRVRVAGVIVTQLGTRVDPDRQPIELDGQPLQPEPRRTYLADKPAGILCTAHDPEGRRTIVAWAAELGADPRLRLYPVGRLDYASEGLILLTNDGELAHALAHPRHHVEKEYRAWTDLPATREQIAAMRAGVVVDAETLRALKVVAEDPRPGQLPVLRIVLGEGRNRHIRRMLETLGLRVERLRRIRIGNLTEADLRGRHLRELQGADLERIRPGAVRHAGGRAGNQALGRR